MFAENLLQEIIVSAFYALSNFNVLILRYADLIHFCVYRVCILALLQDCQVKQHVTWLSQELYFETLTPDWCVYVVR